MAHTASCTATPPSRTSDDTTAELANAQMNEKDDPQQPPPVVRTKRDVVLTMLALCMAVFLAALDQTIVSTALPTIARDFVASQSSYAWVASAYLLAGAAAMPMWSKISDIFGRKPVLLLANFLFFIGSLICALSIDIGMLQAGRVIQGVGAGGIMTLVNICISDMFSLRERGMYLGMVGLTFAVASAIGPVLGGVFTEFVTWRWCFYLNLPCDGLAFALLVLFLRIETPKTPLLAGLKAIDWTGALLIVGGTITFLLGLEFGGVTFAWNSATVICLIVFGVVMFLLFILVESKLAVYPIIPLTVVSRKSNAAALLANFFHGFVFISAAYFLPLYFQAVLGASPLLSGVYLLPLALMLSFMATASGIFIKKTGKYLPPIRVGLLFMTLGFGLFIDLPGSASWARIVIYQLIAGFGIGLLFQAPLVALQSHTSPRDMASATAAFGFTRNFSTAMSLVVGSIIFQNEIDRLLSGTLGGLLPPAARSALGGGAVGSSTGLIHTLSDATQRNALIDVYTHSLRVLWIFYTVLAFVGFLVSLLIEAKVLDTKHEALKTGLDVERQNRLDRHAEREATRDAEKSRAGSVDTAAETV